MRHDFFHRIYKHKVTLIVLVTTVAIIVGLIVWLVIANKNDTAPSQPSDNSSKASETPVTNFTAEQQKTVFAVARVAAAWNGSTNAASTERRYIDAGMSEKLARDYRPVWAEYFGDNITAQINANKASDAPASLKYEKGSEEGTGLFRVGVKINYKGTFNNGKTTALIGGGVAIWYFILDERTGKVTDIEQPMLDELNLPVPS